MSQTTARPIVSTSSPFSGLEFSRSRAALAVGVTDSGVTVPVLRLVTSGLRLFCPTDNPDDDSAPRDCRPTDNFDPQQGGLPPTTLPQTPPPQINEGAAPQTALRSVKLEAFVLTQDFMPLASSYATLMPTIYGEKPVRIDARVMAWRFEGEKVRYCDNTAAISPSKCGHKTTPCDARVDAMAIKKAGSSPASKDIRLMVRSV